MPVKSAKQFRFMEAKANMAGPSQEMAREFLSKTPEKVKSQFASEGRKNKFTSALRKRK